MQVKIYHNRDRITTVLFLLFSWFGFFLFCLFLNLSPLFRTHCLYQWYFGNMSSLMIRTPKIQPGKAEEWIKLYQELRKLCLCTARNPAPSGWSGTCLERKRRGQETALVLCCCPHSQRRTAQGMYSKLPPCQVQKHVVYPSL